METADRADTTSLEAHSEPTFDLYGDALLLGQELRAALYDQLSLASDEAQRAARSLVAMVAAAVGIGMLLASAWLGLMAVGAFALIGLGVSPVVAISIATALDLAMLIVPFEVIRRKSRYLAFPATRRTLQPAAPHEPAPVAGAGRAAA